MCPNSVTSSLPLNQVGSIQVHPAYFMFVFRLSGSAYDKYTHALLRAKKNKHLQMPWQIRMRAFLYQLQPQRNGTEAEELSFMTSKKYSCRASGGTWTLMGSLQRTGGVIPSHATPTILATPSPIFSTTPCFLRP